MGIVDQPRLARGGQLGSLGQHARPVVGDVTRSCDKLIEL
jgi:hypothetical protein